VNYRHYITIIATAIFLLACCRFSKAGSIISLISSEDTSYYTVMVGDNLYSIAKKNKISVDELTEFNHLDPAHITLLVGQNLLIPGEKPLLPSHSTSGEDMSPPKSEIAVPAPNNTSVANGDTGISNTRKKQKSAVIIYNSGNDNRVDTIYEKADKAPLSHSSKTSKVDTVAKAKAEFYLSRALKAIDNKDAGDAEKYLKKATSLNPNYLEAYLVQADLFATSGFFDKAVKSYDKAISCNKLIPAAYYNQATCYLKMRDIDKALSGFNRAINLDSTYVLALGGRAAILIMKKDYYGAIADYSRCINLSSEFMPIYKARGVARLEIGDYTGALSDFDIYLKSEKTDAYAFYERAMVKIKMGKIYDCCQDLLAAQNLGYDEAKAAIRKYCN